MAKELNEDVRTKQDLLYECSNLESRLSDEIVKNEYLETQQQEFINWLKAMSKMYEEQYKDIDIAEHHNCVLQKYLEIIGKDINVGSKGEK